MEEYFPFDYFRPGQEKMFRIVYEGLINKKSVFVHAPTGIGKTASSLGSALKYAQDNDCKVMFLTNRHEHHAIVFDTIKRINKRYDARFKAINLMNKQLLCNQKIDTRETFDFHDYCRTLRKDHLCYFYENTLRNGMLTHNARLKISELGNKSVIKAERIKSHLEDFCPYEIVIELLKNADVIIADYYYIFNTTISLNFLSKASLKLSDLVLIVDEAHNLPDRVMRMNDLQVSNYTLKNAFREVVAEHPYYEKELNSLFIDLEAFVFKKKVREDVEFQVNKDEVKSIIDSHIPYEGFIDLLYDVAENLHKKNKRSYANSLAKFLENWDQDGESIFHSGGIENKRWYLRVFDVDVSSKIYESVASCAGSIFMSGTLSPLQMFTDICGLSSNSLKLSLKSPFPQENTKLYVVDGITTKYELRDKDMYKLYGEILSIIINNIPNNIIVFFPSYEVRESMLPYINIVKEKHIFREEKDITKKEKSEILNFMQKNEGCVLFAIVGANFYEGVDFKGKSAEVAVIVGIPFEKPDFHTRVLINYYDRIYGKGFEYAYLIPTLNKVLQSAGRVVRAEHEKGVIFLLDERYKRYSKFISERYSSLESIHYSELISEIMRINSFLNQDIALSSSGREEGNESKNL